MEFCGGIITVENVMNEGFIFISPKRMGLKAFEELKKLESKKDGQIFAGMLATLAIQNSIDGGGKK